MYLRYPCCRGLFLIDNAGVVRHQVVNDLPLGRNVDEMIRQFRQMRKGVEFHGGLIRNATVGGRLEVFERVEFDTLF